jgi:hypothetical protein
MRPGSKKSGRPIGTKSFQASLPPGLPASDFVAFYATDFNLT